MVKKKEVLIALIAIGLMIIVGQIYLTRNQVIFDGDRVCSKDPGRCFLSFNLFFCVIVNTHTINCYGAFSG